MARAIDGVSKADQNSPKRTNITDVARRAGVSIGTVSNYLNETKAVSPRTQERIDEAIRETGFVINRALRTLRGKRTRTLGLVVPDASNPFFTQLARGVESVARALDYVLVYCDTDGDFARQEVYLRNLAEMRIGGVIIASTAFGLPDLSDLRSIGAPIVVLGDDRAADLASTVVVDQRLGGYLATKHLLDLGHRQIMFAGGPGGDHVLEERWYGAMDAIKEAGEQETILQRVDASGRSVDERSALADRIVATTPRPTAVFCGNDMIAIAVVNKLVRLGWSVPGDFAVVGYDDVSEAQLSVVPLTTLRQSPYDLGVASANLLLAEAEEATRTREHLVYQPELIVRASTVGANSQ